MQEQGSSLCRLPHTKPAYFLHDLWSYSTGRSQITAQGAKKEIYSNPIIHADFSDPDVIRQGADYFCVSSSFTYSPGIPLLHSYDLVNWEIVNYCVQRLPSPRYDRPVHGSGTWAPSIRYHDGTYFVIVPFVDEGIFITTTTDPLGKWSDLHQIVDQKGWIDPCLLWDDDGRVYMVFAYAKSRCGIKHKLSMCELSSDAREIISEPKIIYDGELTQPVIEGPKLYKKDGYYYIFAPAGGVETGWQTVLRSKNIYGPYESRIVMHQGNTNINGPHQGGYVDDVEGKSWFLHFQDKNEYGRIIHLQPMVWQDGWPFIGQEQNGDGIGEPVAEWTKLAVCQNKQVKTHESKLDNFDVYWQWQGNPPDDSYSYISGEKNSICMRVMKNKHSEDSLLWHASNVCTQMLYAPEYTFAVRISLNAHLIGDFGCLGVTGHAYSYVAIARNEGSYQLEMWTGEVTEKQGYGSANETLKWATPLSSSTCHVAVVFKTGGYCEYYYSETGQENEFVVIPTRIKISKGTWTGARIALSALNRNNEESSGTVNFDQLRYFR